MRATSVHALIATVIATVALTASCPSSPTACSKNSDCPVGQQCFPTPGTQTGNCRAPVAEGEGEGGAPGEGEGAPGEGEGAPGEGEGSEGEGEGGASGFALEPGVFTAGATPAASSSFQLRGGFVTPSHPIVSESATFRLTSLR